MKRIPKDLECCDGCGKPPEICVCADITPLANRIGVLILRHPQEQDRMLGTAQIAVRQLENAVMRTGLSWANIGKAWGQPIADPKKWGVLYLGSQKTAAPLPPRPLTIVDRKGEPVAGQDDILQTLEGIVLLDGNWAQAKALWWRNAWMLKCRRLVLQPPQPSFYGNLRKEPRRESVSTIEAIAYTLAALEGDEGLPARILPPFHTMLAKLRGGKKKGGSAPQTAPADNPETAD